MVGFAFVRDPNAINWNSEQDDFPFFNGISSVVASWFISPGLASVLAAGLFFVVRMFVLRSEYSYHRAFIVRMGPVGVMLACVQ